MAIDPLPDCRDGLATAVRLDLSERQVSYLVHVGDNIPVRLSATAYQMLKAVHDGLTLDEIATRIPHDPSDAAFVTEQITIAYSIVVKKLRDIEGRPKSLSLPWGFWWKFPLVSSRITSKLSSYLHPLYKRWYLLCMIAFFVMLTTRSFTLNAWHLHYGLGSIILAYGLFVLSLAAHELGHATAGHYFCAKPGDIGITFYLIYPAFYSDVTSSWCLSRRQRMVVDLGGCYFQLLFGASLLLVCAWTHWIALKLAFEAIVYSCLFSMNPVFKCDGYWLLSDLLGVSNLDSQPKRLFSAAFRAMLGGEDSSLPWPKYIIGALFVYALLSCAIWCRFLMLLWSMARFQLREAKYLFHVALSSHLSPLTPQGCGKLCVFLYVVFLFAVVLYRQVRRVTLVISPKRVRAVWRALYSSLNGSREDAPPGARSEISSNSLRARDRHVPARDRLSDCSHILEIPK